MFQAREEGKAWLRQITRLRSLEGAGGGAGAGMEEGNGSIIAERPIPHLENSPLTRLSPMNLTFTP